MTHNVRPTYEKHNENEGREGMPYANIQLQNGTNYSLQLMSQGQRSGEWQTQPSAVHFFSGEV